MKSKKSKSDHGRGFKRSKKQWENSIGDHIGKFVDRLSVRDILYGLTFIGMSYTIHQILPKAESIMPQGKWQIAPFVYADRNVAEICWVAESMAAAYMLLKIDVDDVARAASAVSQVALGGIT